MIKQIVVSGLLCICSFFIKAQNKYALVVGINDYYETKGVKSDISLHGSVNDASSIRDLLINKFGFKNKNIDTIYNASATRDNIVKALLKKLKQCKAGDAMVFYFSGHGVYLYNSMEKGDSIKGHYNQAMLTSDLYNYDDHLKCFLRDFALKQYFNLFIDKKVILTILIDCCYSGNLAMADPNADPSEQTKSVDVTELLGRLTSKAENTQLLIDSITGAQREKPKGCIVDSAGVIQDNIDSDADGVPDCKDKENFTNAQCFPVNEDGVGACPVDHTLEVLRNTISSYDSIELAKATTTSQAGVDEKSFNAASVLKIAERDTVIRPVDRKNSKFLFISATTDIQKAVEFNDENGVRHSLFTASILRVFKKNPAGINVNDLYQKITDDMKSYHRDQTPTLYADPSRKNTNLLGIKLK